MKKPKIALLIDLASLRVSCEGFKKLTAEIEETYEIVNVKFYSYVAKRNRDFNEYIAAKGYDAVTPIASKRRNKLDTRQVIDGTLIGMSSTVDAVGFATGDGDILPIVSYLKTKGMDVIDINVEEGAYTSEFSGFIKVDTSYLRKEYAAPATKKIRKEPKKVAPAAPAPEKSEGKYAADVRQILGHDSSILSKYKR
ncbi:MAG: NYN domain-containing protein [Clostridiales bacterium]|jgi:uncharacterized LabA/DUF88 family protein|nr:NYN domain-containing protein [Clostridiales bacterium]